MFTEGINSGFNLKNIPLRYCIHIQHGLETSKASLIRSIAKGLFNLEFSYREKNPSGANSSKCNILEGKLLLSNEPSVICAIHVHVAFIRKLSVLVPPSHGKAGELSFRVVS